jgi:hypothetical protein
MYTIVVHIHYTQKLKSFLRMSGFFTLIFYLLIVWLQFEYYIAFIRDYTEKSLFF